MAKVKTDVQCPYCGHCRVIYVNEDWKSVYCPWCRESLFLCWATGVKGEYDKKGFYFHAHEPFKGKRYYDLEREFEANGWI